MNLTNNPLIGQWCGDVSATRAEAVRTSRIAVVVACDTDGVGADCTNCLRLERSVFTSAEFLDLARFNGWYLAYVQAKSTAGLPYMTGVAGMLPYVSIYDDRGVMVKRLTYGGAMDIPTGFVAAVTKWAYLPAPKPVAPSRKPWWMFWK